MRKTAAILIIFMSVILGLWFLQGSFSQTVHAVPTYDCTAVTEIPQIECEALVTLYNATDGDNWSNNTNWMTTNTPCNWYGVTCTSSSVSDLGFFDNNLNGSLPPEIGNLANLTGLNLNLNQLMAVPSEIGSLTNLIWLYMSSNQLADIPPEIGNLTNLSGLTLRQNQLTAVPPEIGNLTGLGSLDLAANEIASLPTEIGNLTNLTYIYLGENQLTTVPPEIGNLTNLRYLYLGQNQLMALPPEIGNLTGLRALGLLWNQLTAVPPEIGNLTNLEYLDLRGNQLMTVPPEIWDFTNLTSLLLGDNQLTTVPSEIGNLTNLTWLELDYLQLTTVPSEIGNLTNLTWLDLNYNRLTVVPPEIGNLTNLTRLHLDDNQLTAVPTEIWNLTNLTDLGLGGNQLTSIPPGISNMTNLTSLDLYGNQLTAIPPEIINLTNLTYLSLSGNQLTAVPPELGNLINLVRLYLSGNQLTAVPPEIANLTNLTHLYLSRNQLAAVPPEIGSLTNLVRLYLDENQLTAVPLEIGSLTNLTRLDLNDNQLTGTMPVELTNLINLSEFIFYNTFWCAPDAPVFSAWLASIDTVHGTGMVCGQNPGSISGIVSAATPLTGAQAVLYRDVGSSWSQWILVDTASVNDAGQYIFNTLGQGVEYRVRFEDGAGSYAPEYYDNTSVLNMAMPVTVTLGMARTGINVILGLPQPPVIDVDTNSGSVNTNPMDGTVTVNMTQGNTSDITITRIVTCTGGVTPSLVKLQLQMATETVTYTMSSIGNDQYRATIPEADISTDATLKIQTTCNGIDETTTVGYINLYDPSGYITNADTNQPVVGATVTLYQVPNWMPRTSPSDNAPNTCESNDSKADGATWSQPAPVDEGVIVNTDLTWVSPRLSHQQTDADGHYGWDVPEGCWYVVVRANGYETLTSPVVGIPPEVTDLDLALTPMDSYDIYLPMIVR